MWAILQQATSQNTLVAASHFLAQVVKVFFCPGTWVGGLVIGLVIINVSALFVFFYKWLCALRAEAGKISRRCIILMYPLEINKISLFEKKKKNFHCRSSYSQYNGAMNPLKLFSKFFQCTEIVIQNSFYREIL